MNIACIGTLLVLLAFDANVHVEADFLKGYGTSVWPYTSGVDANSSDNMELLSNRTSYTQRSMDILIDRLVDQMVVRLGDDLTRLSAQVQMGPRISSMDSDIVQTDDPTQLKVQMGPRISSEIMAREQPEPDGQRTSPTSTKKKKSGSVLRLAGRRMPAIMITWAIEMFAGFECSRFQDQFKQYPLLISFLPVSSAVSGNVGLQTMSRIVEGLALGRVSEHRVFQALSTEMKSGLIVGSVMAFVNFLISLIWYSPFVTRNSGHTWHGSAVFGLTIAMGQFASILSASFTGAVSPLLFKRAGLDPTSAGGPAETTFQDLVGITVLTLACGNLLRAFGDHAQDCPGGDIHGCIAGCQQFNSTIINDLISPESTAIPYNKPCVENCLRLQAKGIC